MDRTALVALLAALALIAVTSAGAAQARHVKIEIHDAFTDDFLTNACHTEVVRSFDATLNVTLLYNQAGLLVKEIDPSGGGTVTLSAPATGNVIAMPIVSVVFDYGAGAQVGSTFTAKFVGLFGHVPGHVASDAGQAIVTGFVFGFDEAGIPLLEFTTFQLGHGNRESNADIVAAICSALAA